MSQEIPGGATPIFWHGPWNDCSHIGDPRYNYRERGLYLGDPEHAVAIHEQSKQRDQEWPEPAFKWINLQ